jgi:glycosyltransferase involved in cell wall biosynthesis
VHAGQPGRVGCVRCLCDLSDANREALMSTSSGESSFGHARRFAPRVSIAMPAYNASRTIEEAVASALGQTYSDFELVVVDNASTDDTAEIVHSFNDPRIRLWRNSANIGAVRNGNIVAQLTRGEYLKFLHADDVLYSTCVERMVEVMDRSHRIGLVFARRRIEIDDESNPDQRSFRELFGDAVRNFGDLGEVNHGPTMLRRWLRAGFPVNWVGEPSSVMLRRIALARLGLFNRRVRTIPDVEMWARMMASHDIGFIDEELSVFRFHADSLSRRHGPLNRSLDTVWVLEGLADSPEVVRAFPEIKSLLERQRRRAAKELAHMVLRDPKLAPRSLRDATAYVNFIARRQIGRPLDLHEPLAPTSTRSPHEIPSRTPRGHRETAVSAPLPSTARGSRRWPSRPLRLDGIKGRLGLGGRR